MEQHFENSSKWEGDDFQDYGDQYAIEYGDHDDDGDSYLAGGSAQQQHPEGSISKATRPAGSKKRKITRIRPLRSCLSCNRRKIKCDRETPCGPCSKRGEGDACSLVAGLSAAHLTNSALAERLAQLEARVEDLEATSITSPTASPGAKLPYNAILSGNSSNSTRQYAAAQGKHSSTHASAHHQSSRRASLVTSGSSSLVRSHSGHNGSGTGDTAEATASTAVSYSKGHSYSNEEPLDVNTHQSKHKDDFVASNCETEEAALALESLCRTEDILERSENGLAGLSNAKISKRLETPNLSASKSRSRMTSGMSMGNILNPPIAENSTTKRAVTMSDSERQYRSTIIVDSTNGGGNPLDHRLQRSIDARTRIFTSANFPRKEFCDHVIWSYFRHLDPLWHVHVGWLFDDEYKEFWKLRLEGRHNEIDPAWGALFFMTLALGLQVTELPVPQHLLPHPSATSSEILSLADSYICDVEELLNAADWARTPQLRVLQTLTLFSAFQSLHNLRDPTTFTMNGAGIRIAQILGLHNLGDTTNPNASGALFDGDLALPTGNQPLKDHMARMMWHTMVVLELVHVTRAGIDVPLASTPYTTALPRNIDDQDFQNLPISATVDSVTPKPAWQLTSVSSLHLRSLFSGNDKILLDLPPDMKATEKYVHVMTIDAELRKWISASPTRQAAQHDYAAYRLSQWQHWSLMADVHGAIVHAHRPYMTRGYSDPRFSFSTKTCLESAKVLCESWQHLRDYVTDQRFWWSSMRYLSAALVIFIDLFIAIDEGCPEEVLAKKRMDIPLICDILQERMSSAYSTTSMFAAAAFGVVSNLLEAEKAKKTAVSARRNSANGTFDQELEPVGRVFKRIAQTMTGGASATKSEGSAQSSSQAIGQPSVKSTDHAIEHATSQPSFSSKRSVKQARRESVQNATESAGPTKTIRMPSDPSNPRSAVGPISDNSVIQRTTSSPNPHLSSLTSASSRSTPTFAMDNGSSLSQHDSYTSVANSPFPWLNSETQGYPYMGVDGKMTITPHLHQQQAFSQGYEQQIQAVPISWDTSTLFHPDPSVLLHSMGFPNTQQQSVMGFTQDDMDHSPALSNQSGQYITTTQGASQPTAWYPTSSTGPY